MKNHLLGKFASGSALISPRHADRVLAGLIGISLEQVQAAAQAQNAYWPSEGSFMSMVRPYKVESGTLYIPIKGVLMHDFPYAMFGMATGYEYIWQAVKRGMEDSAVERIAFMVDSPGGEVAGNFDLADYIFAQRGTKPMTSFVLDSCFSAAYSLASCADRIVATRTAGLGSIGVVTTHLDMSKMLADEGLKITFIYAGKHKVDGNSAQPLSSAAKEHVQSQIDELYGMFVRTVARNRGLAEQKVRATEALDYLATEAVSLGLADEVSSLDAALAAFAVDPVMTLEGDEDMTTKKTPVDAANPDAPVVETVVTVTEPDPVALAAARSDGATAAQSRIVSIMELPEAKNRWAAAWNIATNTDMSVEKAKALLLTLPEAKKDEGNAGGALFERAMERANPEVGAGDGDGTNEISVSDRILAARYGTSKAAQ